MRTLLLFTFFLCMLLACSSKKELPKDILKENEMREVMWDLARADEFVVTFIKDSAVDIKKEKIRLYENIFRIHHTSLAQFKKSLNYYQATPERFAPIADSLAKRQQSNANYGQSQQPQDTAASKSKIRQVPFGNTVQ